MHPTICLFYLFLYCATLIAIEAVMPPAGLGKTIMRNVVFVTVEVPFVPVKYLRTQVLPWLHHNYNLYLPLFYWEMIRAILVWITVLCAKIVLSAGHKAKCSKRQLFRRVTPKILRRKATRRVRFDSNGLDVGGASSRSLGGSRRDSNGSEAEADRRGSLDSNGSEAAPVKKKRLTIAEAMLRERKMTIKPLEENDFPFVLVHGVFGWGAGELMPSYWAGAEMLDRSVLCPSLGPLSSHHARACELFYQLTGNMVDYGEEHSKQKGHKRYGRNHRGKALHEEWSAERPLHFVCHSMGGDTVRVLQHMLENKFFHGYDTSAAWIKSITCISSPLNGSTCVYFMGLEDKHGLKVRKFSPVHFCMIFIALLQYTTLVRLLPMDLVLDHWELDWGFFWGKHSLWRCIFQAYFPLFEVGEVSVVDLSVHASLRRNRVCKTYPSTYYFSFPTWQSEPSPFPFLEKHCHWPSTRMHPLMMFLSAGTGGWQLGRKPYEGFKAEDWYQNDGPVPVYSQLYPRIPEDCAEMHPHEALDLRSLAADGSHQKLRPGVWYHTQPIHLDHMSVTMAPGKQKKKQQALFQTVFKKSRTLSIGGSGASDRKTARRVTCVRDLANLSNDGSELSCEEDESFASISDTSSDDSDDDDGQIVSGCQGR